MTLTVHGHRNPGVGGRLKPIYDLDELRQVAQLRQRAIIEDVQLDVFAVEREDGSGRSWNVIGWNDVGERVSKWVYALKTDKRSPDK